jgi:hypothetical protein
MSTGSLNPVVVVDLTSPPFLIPPFCASRLIENSLLSDYQRLQDLLIFIVLSSSPWALLHCLPRASGCRCALKFHAGKDKHFPFARSDETLLAHLPHEFLIKHISLPAPLRSNLYRLKMPFALESTLQSWNLEILGLF